jgi:hypothetical protein
MSSPSPPPTKANLLKMIRHSRMELEDVIAPISNTQLETIADPAGWTLKDHLAHLAVWESGVAALLRRESRYLAMGIGELVLHHGDFDTVNEVIRAQMEGLSAAEVRRMSTQAHTAILSGLASWSDEELMRPYNEFQPEKVAEGDTRPVFGLVAGNTFGHYAEHLEMMRE